MVVQLERRLFTVDEYHRMIETGILNEDDRVELIKGEIVQMPSIGPHHAACVARLTILFAEQLGRQVVVWVQNPLRLPNSTEPEPDITLLKTQRDFYAKALPTQDDALLVIEVSESTLDSDRGVKMPLYAWAGIAQAWIVNIEDQVIEVYSNPSGGDYQDIRQAYPGETLSLLGFPGVIINVDDVLG